MVWIIALFPAVLVFIFSAASRSRRVWFWSTLCGLSVAFLSYHTYLFMDVAAVLVASYLAWSSVRFEQPEKPGERRASARWDAPRNPRHIIPGGSAHIAEEAPSAEVDDAYGSRSHAPQPRSEEELIQLRAKIQAEHEANAAQREREQGFRKVTDSTSGWLR